MFSPTVRDEIAFGPANLGLPADEVDQRVADTALMLDIVDLLDRPGFQLSGGQKKRVAIASVLSMNPEVLLFDEPTAGLDPRTQQWLLELIGRPPPRRQDDRRGDPRARFARPTSPTAAWCSPRSTASWPAVRPTRCSPIATCSSTST